MFSAIAACLLSQSLVLAPIKSEVKPKSDPDPLGWGFLGVGMWRGPDRRIVLHNVVPNSPAARAELQPGDILLQVGSIRVYSIRKTLEYLSTRRPGTVLRVVIQRGDEKKELTIRLAARPEEMGPPPLRGTQPGLEEEDEQAEFETTIQDQDQVMKLYNLLEPISHFKIRK